MVYFRWLAQCAHCSQETKRQKDTLTDREKHQRYIERQIEWEWVWDVKNSLPYVALFCDSMLYLCVRVERSNVATHKSHKHTRTHIAHAQTQFIVFILSKTFFSIHFSGTFNMFLVLLLSTYHIHFGHFLVKNYDL